MLWAKGTDLPTLSRMGKKAQPSINCQGFMLQHYSLHAPNDWDEERQTKLAYRVDSQLPPSNCWPFKRAQSTQQDVQAYQKQTPILSYQQVLFLIPLSETQTYICYAFANFIVYTHKAVFLFVGLNQWLHWDWADLAFCRLSMGCMMLRARPVCQLLGCQYELLCKLGQGATKLSIHVFSAWVWIGMLETQHPDCLLASALGSHQPCKKLSLACSKLATQKWTSLPAEDSPMKFERLLKAQQVPIFVKCGSPKAVQQRSVYTPWLTKVSPNFVCFCATSSRIVFLSFKLVQTENRDLAWFGVKSCRIVFLFLLTLTENREIASILAGLCSCVVHAFYEKQRAISHDDSSDEARFLFAPWVGSDVAWLFASPRHLASWPRNMRPQNRAETLVGQMDY